MKKVYILIPTLMSKKKIYIYDIGDVIVNEENKSRGSSIK